MEHFADDFLLSCVFIDITVVISALFTNDCTHDSSIQSSLQRLDLSSQLFDFSQQWFIEIYRFTSFEG